MLSQMFTLPEWAFQAAIGGDSKTQVFSAAFKPIWDIERQLNLQEHGKSPRSLDDEILVQFAVDENESLQVVTYFLGYNQIELDDSLENALGIWLETMDSYCQYEFGIDDPLVDALRHCVEYRILSENDCMTLVAGLEREKAHKKNEQEEEN